MIIYCCECDCLVEPKLLKGNDIYPHRKDLADLNFWKCPGCGNYVGCHNKTNNPTRPLGCIPTKEIKAIRQEIHKLLDPLWMFNTVPRKEIYKVLSAELGYTYHTANIKSVEEAEKVLKAVKILAKKYEKDNCKY